MLVKRYHYADDPSQAIVHIRNGRACMVFPQSMPLALKPGPTRDGKIQIEITVPEAWLTAHESEPSFCRVHLFGESEVQFGETVYLPVKLLA